MSDLPGTIFIADLYPHVSSPILASKLRENFQAVVEELGNHQLRIKSSSPQSTIGLDRFLDKRSGPYNPAIRSYRVISGAQPD